MSNRPFSQHFAMSMGALMLLVALPYGAALIMLQSPASGFASLLTQYKTALGIFPDSDTRMDLATITLAAARQGEASMMDAEAALRDSLAHRPQDPLGWARLAYVLGEEQKFADIGAPLARSIETGSYLPGFMQWRFLLGIKYWPYFTAAQQKLVAEQANLIWQTKANDFIRLARMPALASQIESIMQAYYPDQLQAFLQRRHPLRHTRTH